MDKYLFSTFLSLSHIKSRADDYTHTHTHKLSLNSILRII